MSVSKSVVTRTILQNWEKLLTADGFVYYLNKKSNEIIWDCSASSGKKKKEKQEQQSKFTKNTNLASSMSTVKKTEAVIARNKRKKKLYKLKKQLTSKLLLYFMKNSFSNSELIESFLSGSITLSKLRSELDLNISNFSSNQMNILPSCSNEALLDLKVNKCNEKQNETDSKELLQQSIKKHMMVFQAVVVPLTGDNISEKIASEMKKELVQKLEKDILKPNGEPNGLLLHFKNVRLIKPGWLLLTCKDNITLNWVLAWNPLSRGQFRIMEASEAPWPIKINFTIIAENNFDLERSLKLLAAQNRDLCFEDWYFHRLEGNGSSRTFQFMANQDVGKLLLSTGMEIHYELTSLPLNVIFDKHMANKT